MTILCSVDALHDGPVLAILGHLFCPAGKYNIFGLTVSIIDQACSFKMVIITGLTECQELGISPGYYECGPQLLYIMENGRKV